jgi:hypothetical protein
MLKDAKIDGELMPSLCASYLRMLNQLLKELSLSRIKLLPKKYSEELNSTAAVQMESCNTRL